jgi:CPA2 family monovalent cation:H+ antiporter-2
VLKTGDIKLNNMEDFSFLQSLVIIFGLSAVVVFILGKFRIPSIIGFLAAGVLLGPYGLELIENIHLVEIFAEIGVVLLLFTIGLEFSLKGLMQLRKAIFVGGFFQVSITALIAFAVVYYSGFNIAQSVIMGMLVSLSSTAIVLKLLADRAELDSPHGRVSLGVLIFQDFCVVLFILIVPMLKGSNGDAKDIIIVLVESLIFIAVVILAARWLVPLLLHQIVHTRMRELFVISIIFICLGTAYMTYKLGFSLALGAFIAGLVISESEYSYQAISDILPFKDSFNGLFFISIGMLMDINFFLSHALVIILIVTGIIAGKTVLSTLAVLLSQNNLRVSFHSALILSQIGEFAFVLAVTALKEGLMSENMYQMFLSSSIITMLLTPLLVASAPRISIWLVSRKKIERFKSMKLRGTQSTATAARSDHVIIIGFGANGRNLALVLKELEVPYVILELNSRTVMQLKKEGEPAFYGDGTSREILHKLGIDRARVMVISITDASATRKIVMTARSLNPSLYIVVRTRYIGEVHDLLSDGADEVVPADFETSIELFSRVLNYYQMPKTLISRYAEQFRKDHYSMFVRGETPKRLFHETLALMPDVNYGSFIIEEGSTAAGRKLGELDIENITGTDLIAVRRGNQTLMQPDSEFILSAGDFVLLIGDEESLEDVRIRFFSAKSDH